MFDFDDYEKLYDYTFTYPALEVLQRTYHKGLKQKDKSLPIFDFQNISVIITDILAVITDTITDMIAVITDRLNIASFKFQSYGNSIRIQRFFYLRNFKCVLFPNAIQIT